VEIDHSAPHFSLLRYGQRLERLSTSPLIRKTAK